MEEDIVKYIDECFSRLINVYNFKRVDRINEGVDFMVDFYSTELVISIEFYRREFYCKLSKENTSDSKIELFNLLDYLKRNTASVPQSNYFKNEKNINQSLKKQVKSLSNVIYDNFADISDFFKQDELESRFAEIREFIISKHPKLFKR